MASTTAQVPLWTLTLLLGDSWWTRPENEALRSCVRKVGAHYEIDTAGDGVGGVLSEAATSYLEGDRSFARRLGEGKSVGAWVSVRRLLGQWRQGTPTASNKRGDLRNQFAALSRHRELHDVASVLLASEVNVAALALLCVEVHQEGTLTKARVRLEGSRHYEAALGGAGWAGEIEREFVLEANSAAWRDRQVRRLSEVGVWAVELHADPSPWQEPLLLTTKSVSAS